MRKAKYSAKSVHLPNASRIGFDVTIARPGSWVAFYQNGIPPVMSETSGRQNIGRVLGRIDKTPDDGLEDCSGWLAVMTLNAVASGAYIRWVNPKWVTHCLDKPPAALLAWITGEDWPSLSADIPRLIAMALHGTCSEQVIETRNDPKKPYNCRDEYVAQFIL